MEWVAKWLMSLKDGQEDYVLGLFTVIIMTVLFIIAYVAIKKKIDIKKLPDGTKELKIENVETTEKVEPIKTEEVEK